MEDKILVNLSTNHIFECATNILGREGEGNTAQLEISVPPKLRDCSLYLDFKKPNGEKLRTPQLEIENGVAVYDVVPYLLTDSGEVKVQAVLITANGGIWKTSVKKFHNYGSINAEDDINDYPEKEDFFTEAQRVLDELSGEIDEIADILANNTAFANKLINKIDKDREYILNNIADLLDDVGGLKDIIDTIEDKCDAIDDRVAEVNNFQNIYSITKSANSSNGTTIELTNFELGGVYLVQFICNEDKGSVSASSGTFIYSNDNESNYEWCISLGQYRLKMWCDNAGTTANAKISNSHEEYGDDISASGQLNFYKIGNIQQEE